MKREIIKKGFDLLKKEKQYDQFTVVRKLRYLNFSLAEATFSNILTGKTVSDKTLLFVSKGIGELIEAELGYIWQDEKYVWQENKNWHPTIIRETSAKELSTILNPGLVFYPEGRLSIQQKVEFITTAQKEVIEFGVTLNTFSSYFFSRKDNEFKNHVEKLLNNGINFKCYMLDPECNEASIYFEDRRREMREEIRNADALKETMRKLLIIKKDMDEAQLPGSFEIFAYKHIPYNYFIVVDGNTYNGKMMTSHYMYGLPRAKCPVLEISKSGNFDLFQRYWASLQKLVKTAKSISVKG